MFHCHITLVKLQMVVNYNVSLLEVAILFTQTGLYGLKIETSCVQASGLKDAMESQYTLVEETDEWIISRISQPKVAPMNTNN